MDGVEVRCTSDAQLWRNAVDGDAGSMGVLFERHADTVYNHCFRRTGLWSAAEDLTSMVFLEAWRQRRGLRLSEDGSIVPWLLGLANNMVRNHRRALRRYGRLLGKLPPADAEPDLAEDASTRLDAEAEMQRILAAARQLSEVDQDVLALCVWSGLSYAEASVALGVPVGTVRSRLSRARAHLRELLPPASPAGKEN